jgi:hypothetical protein
MVSGIAEHSAAQNSYVGERSFAESGGIRRHDRFLRSGNHFRSRQGFFEKVCGEPRF